MPRIRQPRPTEQVTNQSKGTTIPSTLTAYQKVHATKADEAFPDGGLASIPPQRSNFLDAPSVEASGTVEHNRSGHDEECPLCSGYAPSPDRCHQEHPRRVVTRDQCHVYDANDECWDRDNERERKPVEKALPLTKPHAASTFLKCRWVIDGHVVWGRVC